MRCHHRLLCSLVPLALALLPACGGPGGGAGPGVRPAAGGGSTKGSSFVRQESAIYLDLDPLVLRCTLADNARAGRAWLRAVSGQQVAELSPRAQVELLGRVLRGGVKEPSPGELADAGWLLAELVRTVRGGRYELKGGQVALSGAGSRPLYPLPLIEAVAAGEGDLSAVAEALSGPAKEDPACADVPPIDVLAHRFAPKDK